MLLSLSILDEDLIRKKIDKLGNLIKNHRVIIAFSGGVDSAVMALLAKKFATEVKLVMQIGSSVGEGEQNDAMELAKSLDLPIEFIEYDEVDYSIDYSNNPENRCYYCKKILHSFLEDIRLETDFDLVLTGTNYSDLEGHRPGHNAVKEYVTKNPLVEAELTKEEIRWIARKYKLSVWDKPAMACLASRMKTGTKITVARLQRVKYSEFEIQNKFNFNILRVRDLGLDSALVEVGSNEIEKLSNDNNWKAVSNILHNHGFVSVKYDDQGYIPATPTKWRKIS